MKKEKTFFSTLCFFLITSISAQICINNGKYFEPNSTYHENLRLILPSLPYKVTEAQDRFFYNGSIGQEPNRVYAIGMCIPGSTSNDCSDCIKTASDGLLKSCTNQTDGFTWRGDPTLCLVRYSNASFSRTVNLDPRVLLTNTGDLNSNLTEFKTIWEELMFRMIATTSKAKSKPSSSNNHYTADVVALTTFQDIYALMQCMPDISSRDCENCLQRSVADYQSCCGGKQGGVVMRPSCFLRWDLYKFSKAFDNLTVASTPQA